MDNYVVNISYNNGEYIIEVLENDEYKPIKNNGDPLIDIFAYNYSTITEDMFGESIINDNVTNWTNSAIMVKILPKVGIENAINPDDITGYYYSLSGVYTNKNNSIYSGGKTTGKEGNLFLIDTNDLLNTNLIIGIITKKETYSSTIKIRIDKELPVLSSSTSGTFEKDKKQISIVGSDGSGSGIKAFRISSTDALSCSGDVTSYNITAVNGIGEQDVTEEGTYYICSIDEALNVSKIPYVLNVGNIVDKGPNLIYPKGKGNWTNSSYTINFGCDVNSESGCQNSIRYSIFDIANNKYLVEDAISNTPVVNYIMDISNGYINNVRISWYAWNNVGVLSEKIDYEISIKVDKKPPLCTTSGAPSNWVNYDVTLKGICDDQGGSGCQKSEVTNTISYTNNSNISAGTIYDNVGNKTVCNPTLVKVDKTSPKCNTTTTYSGWTNKDVTITGTCSDNESGCKNTPTATFTNEMNSSKSPGTVYDNVGNSTDCPSIDVKIDKTAPTCSTSGGNTYDKPSTSLVTINGICIDKGGSECRNEYVNFKKVYSYPTRSYDYYSAYDNAGNYSFCGLESIYIDKSKPYTPYIYKVVSTNDHCTIYSYNCNIQEDTFNNIECNINLHIEGGTGTWSLYFINNDTYGKNEYNNWVSGYTKGREAYMTNCDGYNDGTPKNTWIDDSNGLTLPTGMSHCDIIYRSVDYAGNYSSNMTIHYHSY